MKTLIDLDEELFAQAKEILQTATKKDTVNAALAEVIALAGRRALIARLVEGGLPDLLNDEVMAAAWRQ